MKRRQNVFPSKDELLSYFDFAMHRESGAFTHVQYDRRKEQGHTILTAYYDAHINSFPTDVEVELKINRYILDGVPVTGKIDKLEFADAGCTVIDYKTGDPDRNSKQLTAPPDENNPNGGDYWRQMVFYKLLIEHYPDRPMTFNSGTFDYIQQNSEGAFKRFTVPVFKQDEAIVMQQLKDSYGKIMNHEFDKGCGEEDCRWCNFARKYDLVNRTDKYIIELDDV
jgi:DNA helicase-2/ATP-dependent DNA helicase PcrA